MKIEDYAIGQMNVGELKDLLEVMLYPPLFSNREERIDHWYRYYFIKAIYNQKTSFRPKGT